MDQQGTDHEATMRTLRLNSAGKDGHDRNHSSDMDSCLPSADSVTKSLSTDDGPLSRSPDSATTKVLCAAETSIRSDPTSVLDEEALTLSPRWIWQRLSGHCKSPDRPWHRTWIRCKCYNKGYCVEEGLTQLLYRSRSFVRYLWASNCAM
jgi:hypothetical protein